MKVDFGLHAFQIQPLAASLRRLVLAPGLGHGFCLRGPMART